MYILLMYIYLSFVFPVMHTPLLWGDFCILNCAFSLYTFKKMYAGAFYLLAMISFTILVFYVVFILFLFVIINWYFILILFTFAFKAWKFNLILYCMWFLFVFWVSSWCAARKHLPLILPLIFPLIDGCRVFLVSDVFSFLWLQLTHLLAFSVAWIFSIRFWYYGSFDQMLLIWFLAFPKNMFSMSLSYLVR